MKSGIICLETEWEHTRRANRRPLRTEPLLEFVRKLHDCSVIYRRIATWSELVYYMDRFSMREYKDYRVVYLSFHGMEGAICLEGEKEKVTLDDLADNSNSFFADRSVHFSSCETFHLENRDLRKFKKDIGAEILSGYTTSVDGALSAINDIAYFNQLFEYDFSKMKVKKAMSKYYGELGEKLGFVII